jgi:CO dehydrogenase maturation factor
MKVLICGKGGTGKSTVAALLAEEMAARGKRVLIVDSDESNFGLPALLGMDRPKDFMEYFGGKKLLFDRVKTLKQGLKTGQLPSGYLTEKGNIRLLAFGKIYDFGEGCACPINALAARFLENVELEQDELLIADTDAGVEHLGRGVEKGCDVLLVVVEPSRESIELAQRIAGMVRDLGKELYYVLNKTDEETERTLLESLPKDMVIAAIPNDRRVFQCGLEGSKLVLKLEAIGKIADFLREKAGPSGRGAQA